MTSLGAPGPPAPITTFDEMDTSMLVGLAPPCRPAIVELPAAPVVLSGTWRFRYADLAGVVNESRWSLDVVDGPFRGMFVSVEGRARSASRNDLLSQPTDDP